MPGGWGGINDIWNGAANFHEASVDLSTNLQADGHFVIECNHGSGPNWASVPGRCSPITS